MVKVLFFLSKRQRSRHRPQCAPVVRVDRNGEIHVERVATVTVDGSVEVPHEYTLFAVDQEREGRPQEQYAVVTYGKPAGEPVGQDATLPQQRVIVVTAEPYESDSSNVQACAHVIRVPKQPVHFEAPADGRATKINYQNRL